MPTIQPPRVILLTGTLVLILVTILVFVYEQKKFVAEQPVEPTPSEMPGDDGTVSIRLGETKYANGIRIALTRLVSDNRCPIDVTCITGGAATFEVMLMTDTESEAMTLSTDGPSHAIDTSRVSITEVLPVPVSTTSIDPNEYLVTFKVTGL